MTMRYRPSREEMEMLNEFVSGCTGLYFPEHKIEILQSRLLPRLQALGLRRFGEYYAYLQANIDGELGVLTQLITNNETYFFRETHQFTAFFESLDKLKTGAMERGALRLLCAGCSSGEEAYTLNIFAKENQYRYRGVDLTIDAFDIDSTRLEIAQGAEYGQYSLRGLDEATIARYFRKGENGRYALREPYRTGVKFSRGNLLDLSTFQKYVPYDAIFCRNVIIYFSEPAIHKSVHNLAVCIRMGGLLFLGHSESIIGLSPCFEAVRVSDCIAYKRVQG
ncbi:MAG: protein-glutamate O-methyltransferase CheR [Acidobacteriota bacterium]